MRVTISIVLEEYYDNDTADVGMAYPDCHVRASLRKCLDYSIPNACTRTRHDGRLALEAEQRHYRLLLGRVRVVFLEDAIFHRRILGTGLHHRTHNHVSRDHQLGNLPGSSAAILREDTARCPDARKSKMVQLMRWLGRAMSDDRDAHPGVADKHTNLGRRRIIDWLSLLTTTTFHPIYRRMHTQNTSSAASTAKCQTRTAVRAGSTATRRSAIFCFSSLHQLTATS